MTDSTKIQNVKRPSTFTLTVTKYVGVKCRKRKCIVDCDISDVKRITTHRPGFEPSDAPVIEEPIIEPPQPSPPPPPSPPIQRLASPRSDTGSTTPICDEWSIFGTPPSQSLFSEEAAELEDFRHEKWWNERI